ncbi:MAG: DEAD/DEAH box helicase [Candidatus Babeliales bacterium]
MSKFGNQKHFHDRERFSSSSAPTKKNDNRTQRDQPAMPSRPDTSSIKRTPKESYFKDAPKRDSRHNAPTDRTGRPGKHETGNTRDAKPFQRSRPVRNGDGNFRSPAGLNRGNNRMGGRKIKKFDPSDFIKKVEQLVPSAVYTPKHTFSDFLIEEQLKKNILKRGYTAPTPIQDQAIPLLLEGKDVVGTANTGTGKTAAFLIPLVNNLLTKKTKRVLIITPTRELAAQIQDELSFFKENTPFSSALCIGGLNINHQINLLSKHPEFVIGTPGRLKDLEQHRLLRLSDYTSIVLDEVDTMLDMGFINDMTYIISRLPKDRHSLFFSATISQEIKGIMDGFLRNPIMISVKTRQAAENVNQDVIKTNNKIETLHDLLIKPDFTKVIVFVRTKHSADKLAKNLKERGFQIVTIHGDKTQMQRKKALELFKDDHVKILLATDIVARGIDIDDVSHIINFDMPQTHDDYIHRIGRTGRANKVGQALTFIEG